MTRAAALAVALVTAALLGVSDGAATQAQNPVLTASVGPDLTISLRNAQGAAVTRVDPGTYTINVEDLSEFHTFQLTGPGVSQDTGLAFTGNVSWTVTFGNGSYVFQCTAHPTAMRGSVASGTTPGPAPKPKPLPTVTPKTGLVLVSGPGQVITLKTGGGKKVTQMKVGTYNVTVRDRSQIHNAHLKGPGYNKKTTIPYTGKQTWKVALKRAGTLRFLCDPHAALGMKGSAKIVR